MEAYRILEASKDIESIGTASRCAAENLEAVKNYNDLKRVSVSHSSGSILHIAHLKGNKKLEFLDISECLIDRASNCTGESWEEYLSKIYEIVYEIEEGTKLGVFVFSLKKGGIPRKYTLDKNKGLISDQLYEILFSFS